ncbi:hypothetical protein D3C71_1938270 [compost metagenome]
MPGGNDLRTPDAGLVWRLCRILHQPAVWFSGALFLLVLRGIGGGDRGDSHRHVYAVLVPDHANLALGAVVLCGGDPD